MLEILTAQIKEKHMFASETIQRNDTEKAEKRITY